MSAVNVHTMSGSTDGSVDLDPQWFGVEPNTAVVHQVVTAQLAARRAGTQSTKTRAEVAGGGAKPWKQKGTGRARQGSIRAPHWRGGGVALGPKPRSYAQRTPKKMIRLALRSALSDRADEGRIVVLDQWDLPEPSTKAARQALAALGVDGRVLVVLEGDDRNAWLSMRNLPKVHLLEASQLNAHDVVASDWVVFTRATLPSGATQPTPSPQPQAHAALLERPHSEAVLSAGVAVPGVERRETAMDDADLPQREKPAPGQKRKAVRPEDRVKSVSDKDDPKFAAARRRAAREDALRAQLAAKRTDRVADEEAETDDGSTGGGFSFNDTSKGDPR
ncbi:MAG: 50S ribosomal protein L4 [Acidimicrobiia bacterium]|nr:50S ribosomal protein L4 [Acidimicrobiia bacterium]